MDGRRLLVYGRRLLGYGRGLLVYRRLLVTRSVLMNGGLWLLVMDRGLPAEGLRLLAPPSLLLAIALGASREARRGPHPEGSREHPGEPRERPDGRHGDDDRPRPKGRLETLVGRYGPTRGAQRHAGAQDRNLPGILALGFGIAAVALLLPSFGALFFLSLPLGIGAMVLGVIGKRKVDRRVAARHRRPAKAGLVLGAIGTVLSLLVILLLALGVAGLRELIQSTDRSGGGSGGQQETLEQRNDEQRRMLEERAARQRREFEERSARQREELRRRNGDSP